MTPDSASICAAHPETPATGICARCGSFICVRCQRSLRERVYCETCFSRPDVDPLRAIEERFRGRRDGFVWFLGLTGTLINLGIFVFILLTLSRLRMRPDLFRWAHLIPVTLSLALLVVFASYLMLKPWARLGLFAVLLVAFLLSLANILSGSGHPVTGSDFLAELMAIGVLLSIPTVVTISAYRSPRNRLAFDLEVSREGLLRLHTDLNDNRLARTGAVLAIFSLLIPGLSLVAATLSFVALKRVDPEHVPPIGRRRTALFGLALSGVGLLTSSGLVLLAILTAPGAR